MLKKQHNPLAGLSRRERQIMEVLYRRGRASVAEVRAGIPDPPSYSAVRALLRVLEEKGHARHEEEGPRYVYLPSVPRAEARNSALRHMVRTFFDGSPAQAVAALLGDAESELTSGDLAHLSALIESARKEGR
ncbi:MAG TPA: BlaI/MecI/CopY family transcriptional regulator [Longimicrobiales bacterium]|jgi:predicted transcriptional regulator|nr:BlaI/MecI/CopY family transcriptional regulator [Longimicrobiales bacterium]